MDAAELTLKLKQRAGELGFSLVGVAPAVSPPGAARLDEWLSRGYAGQMHYLADRRQAYADPGRVLDGTRSVLMLAMDYRTAEPAATEPGQGRVSRYAWGSADYHDVIRERLNALADVLREHVPAARVRGVVDTAPLLEREFAQLAGLGWIGKHTLLINRDRGSWFFLAALLTDIELVADRPHETDHCGKCRACLDACPTGAFPQAYVLDASRCISYLTIELRDAIPAELRPGVGDWLFGCDVCQAVCPWNNHAKPSDANSASRVVLDPGRGGGPPGSQASQYTLPAFEPRPDSNPLDVIPLFDLDDDAFRACFRHTPLWRAKRRGLLRNAAIVLGNRPTPAALPALCTGLHDIEPLVRAACAWALGRYTEPRARQVLEERLRIEADVEVCREITAALTQATVSEQN
jgi:epoxyqueuosine reductase